MANQFSKNTITSILDDNLDVIVERLNNGEQKTKLCDEYGIKYHTFYRWQKLRNIDIPDQRKQFSNKPIKKCVISKETLFDLYHNKKMTLGEIGKIYNVCDATILTYMKECDIIRRTKAEAMNLLYVDNEQLREVHRRNANNGVIGVFKKGNQYQDTWIEKKFRFWCIENLIQFIPQFQLYDGGHRYDFYLPENNLIVELDGLYWHSSFKQKEKDKKFNDEAILFGYDIIRVTDKEIKNNENIFECMIKNI